MKSRCTLALLFCLSSVSIASANVDVNGIIVSTEAPDPKLCVELEKTAIVDYSTERVFSDFLILFASFSGDEQWLERTVAKQFESSSYRYAKTIGANFVFSQHVSVPEDEPLRKEFEDLLFEFEGGRRVVVLPPIFFECNNGI